MKKILIIILAILCATSVFADFKFTGKAKIVWAYDFATSQFTAKGREGEAAVNMTVRASGDFYSIVLQGPLFSRSTAKEGMKGRITLKAVKLLEEFDIKLDKIKALDIYAGNSIIRANHVYADPFGHDDGSLQLLIATNSRYFPYGFELTVDNYTFKTGMTIASEHQEYGFNLKGSFLDGALLAEAGFAYNSDKEFKSINVNGNNYRYGHKFEDGDNGKRFGTSFAVDVAKLAKKDNLNLILSADAQLNLDNKDANAYYAAAVVKYKNWFGGFEYKYIPKTIEAGNGKSRIDKARITAVEGIVQYTFDTKHSPKVFATAGYILDRHDLDSDYKDSSLLFSVGASIKVKEMTVKVYSSINLSKYSDRKILKEEYQNVKNRVGHIPRMMDFVESNSISPLVFIGKYKSYYNFLKKYDNEFVWNATERESKSLDFFSAVVANGLRPYEELIIRNLIDKGKTTVEDIRCQTFDKYGFDPLIDSIISAGKLLSDEFFDRSFRKTYLNIKYCTLDDNVFSITDEFKTLLVGIEYKNQLSDILNVAQSEYETHYLSNRRMNDLALYEKYTRQDVCRLLNWKLDEHGTINGYKVDPLTHTCPIFVTYNKDSENISATTDYSDHFLNSSVFLWQTRTGKDKITKEVEQISGKSELGIIRCPLFITKDKKIKNGQTEESEYNFSIVDNGATYHYYMGDVTFRKATETTRAGKKIYDVEFLMNEPVKPEMYEYFEALKQLKESTNSSAG